MFPGERLPQVKSLLDKNDHPELDNSDLASDDLITKFMCMVGQLQWAVTLGRYDILAHVMSMSREDEKNLWLPLKDQALCC